jgi:Flp pilus assembly CpaF family ATPase
MTVRADAYDGIRRDALVRIERRRLRPEGDLDEVQSEVHRAVDEYQRRAHLGDEIPLSDPGEMIGRVLRSITDFGPLTELIARPDVEEIFFEGPRVSYLDSSGRLRGLTTPTGEGENRQIVERLLAPTDRQLNTKHPIVQARVLQGSARLTAAIPQSEIACRRRSGDTRFATSHSELSSTWTRSAPRPPTSSGR